MLRLRLILDGTAAVLLLVGLAYYWLDNKSHELFGTGMFLLLLVHNVFNRRWYGTVSRRRVAPRTRINIVATLVLLAAMIALLVTSVLISRTVFTFIPLDGGFTTRQVHKLAAYWALVMVSVHLGLRWSMIMGVIRRVLGITIPSKARTTILRFVAVALALCGVQSSFDMGIGSKLAMRITMDMWDFKESALGFFAHHLSIGALYIVLAHYTTSWLPYMRRMPGSIASDSATNR